MTPIRAAGVLLSVFFFAAQDALSQEETEILGKRSPIVTEAEPAETVSLETGTRLLERPDPDAPALTVVRFGREVAVLDRDGDWLLVRHESWKGWVRDPARGVAADGSLLDRPRWIQEVDARGNRRFVPAPSVAPVLADVRPARIARSRELLGDHRVLDLGSYRFYTDVEDQRLLDQLALAVGELESIYRGRTGLALADAERAAVVLFADEAAYRTYTAEIPELAGLQTLGHQSHRLAVTFAGNRTTAQIRQILVHELVHLLNRRALPQVLPSWLEEGLAEDISLSRVDADGRLLLDSLSGAAVRSLGRITITDGMGALTALLRTFGQPAWPRVVEIVDTDWEDFVQPDSRLVYYTQAAFFVRFLLDERRLDGRLARGFRAFLAATAARRPPGGPTERRPDLWRELEGASGLGPSEIEAAYEAWIWARGLANGVVDGAPGR